jgi:putative transposase
MSRPLRLDHAGAVWHVTSRGNEKRDIFRDAQDRRDLLRVLGRVVEVCRWRIHAYVLMGNHYHLLLETPEPTLSKGMHQLNGTYTRHFNTRHERIGHLFQGRFKAILVEKEAHLLELIRYVVLNPVRAGLVSGPEQWEWSNFACTAGLSRPPVWLEIDWTLSQFGGGAFASDRYMQFVDAGKANPRTPWVNLRKQVFLGGDRFRRRVQAEIGGRTRSTEVPWPQRHCFRPTFIEIVRAAESEFGCGPGLLLQKRRSPLRLAVAFLARHEAGLRLSDFAGWLGVRRWAASHLASQAEKLIAESPIFREQIDKIRDALRKVTLSQT